MSNKREDIGKGVLADLAALREKGTMASVLPNRRVDPVPKTIAGEMSEGYLQTIARLKAERESGRVILELDPKQVRPSSVANRHSLSLDESDKDLKLLKADIASQGQLEPIRVRPAAGAPEGTYEIVYGHRRHAACLALDHERAHQGGFKVLALLDAGASEVRAHVLKMYQENAARKDLSAFEQAHMFRLWLDQKIFESQTQIANEIGVSRQLVSKYMKILELPEAVIAAFGDPRAFALRWIDLLEPALASHRERVLASAAQLAKLGEALPPEAVLEALLTGILPVQRKRAPAAESDIFRVGRETVYKVSRKGSRVAFRFGDSVPESVAREAVEVMQKQLRAWLKDRLKKEPK